MLRQEGNQQYKKFVDTKRKEQIYAELQNEHKKYYSNWYTYHTTYSVHTDDVQSSIKL